MIRGIGTDIADVERIEQLLDKRSDDFAEHTFTPAERDYCLSRPRPATHFAGRFAAKEALLKMLGSGLDQGIGWHDVEIVRLDDVEPQALLHGQARIVALKRGITRIHLSISHESRYAVAFAVGESL